MCTGRALCTHPRGDLGTSNATLSTSLAPRLALGVFTYVENKMGRIASLADNKTETPKKRQSTRVTTPFRIPLCYFEVKTICILIKARKQETAVELRIP